MSFENGRTQAPPACRPWSRLLLAAAALALAPALAGAAAADDLTLAVPPAAPTAYLDGLASVAPGPAPSSALGEGPTVALLDVAPSAGRALGLARPAAEIELAALNLGRNVSGLPWRSGASCALPTASAGEAAAAQTFAQWRGRPLDETDFGANHPTWDVWLSKLREPEFKAAMALTPQPVVALAMFPKSVPKQYANCASGKFDSYMRQVGGILKAEGAVSNGRHAILRLGWEANIGSGSHPWGVDTTADATGYQKCFQRWVTVLRPILPGVMFEWTNAKVSHLPGPPSLTYPGDSYADLWGLHYYDAGGQFHTQALWSAYYNSTYKGGPQGLGSWLTAAAKAGKKLGVPEWGIRRPDGVTNPAPSDDPFYIQQMFNTFKTHTATISYENYFNCFPQHIIYPNTLFPKASTEYRKLWSAGP